MNIKDIIGKTFICPSMPEQEYVIEKILPPEYEGSGERVLVSWKESKTMWSKGPGFTDYIASDAIQFIEEGSWVIINENT